MRFGDRIFGERVQEIVEALGATLDATIDLIDRADRRHHLVTRNGRWLSTRNAGDDAVMPGTCTLRVEISDRWTLRIFRKGPLHHDVEAVAAWGARLLKDHLLRRETRESDFPPPQGNGGASGSAELGIPLAWLRKTQN
jgi:hypothetical protein